MATITTHVGANDIVPELPHALTRLIGDRHRTVQRHALKSAIEPGDTQLGDDTLVWMRDYQPIFVRGHKGEITARLVLAEPGDRWRARARDRAAVRG